MLHRTRPWSSNRARLALLVLAILTTSTSVLAQITTPQAPPTTATATLTPRPSSIPSPAPALQPGTRELQDSLVVADLVRQGQLQTYHFAIAQPQRLPVKRQLERIIFHPNLEKRQGPTPGTATGTPTPSVSAPLPTRTIAPTLPAPFDNGTYAVFISVSTCSAPKSGQEICPPLELYVSTSASQPLPGPGQDTKTTQLIRGQEGLIQFTAYVSKELFFSLHAPTLQGAWTGDWSVEVGASTQGYVRGFDESLGLVLDDTDSATASFLTTNFTAVPTFKVFLLQSDMRPLGLLRSLCAVEAINSIPLNSRTDMIISQTNRTSNLDGSMGTEILPMEPTFEQFGQRRQVILQTLKSGTNYTVFFVRDVLNQAGAEVLYRMTTFKTKRHDNCMLITDLDFCREVAYAVPVTPLSQLSNLPGGGPVGTVNGTLRQDVKTFYDGFTSSLMDNFNKVLGQYDCSKSQYSLIRNCTDCTRAYRRWLCALTIPRCTDMEDIQDPQNIGYTPPAEHPTTLVNPYLLDRSQGPVVVERDTASSRGALAQLNQSPLLNPGDYGEVLPCIDLCYDVVQSCPNFLGFNCPVKNMAGNYARMNADGFQCNGLGVVPLPKRSSSTLNNVVDRMRTMQGFVLAVLVAIVVSFT